MVSSFMEELSKTQNRLIPEDLLFNEILPKLPTKSTARLKSVSKTWLSQISGESSLIAGIHTAAGEEPGTIIWARHKAEKQISRRMFYLDHKKSSFVEMDISYLRNTMPQPGVLLPIGSFNGLVCLGQFYSDETSSLSLWNPATREVHHLPEASACPGFKLSQYTFGFDAQSGDHKVLRFEETEDGEAALRVQIFTRSSGCWRGLTTFPGIRLSWDRSQGLTVDGAMHWAVETPNHQCPLQILSFDVGREQFLDLDGPLCGLDEQSREGFKEIHLIEYRGSLGALLLNSDQTKCQLWVKKKKGSWEKVPIINLEQGPVRPTEVFFIDDLLLGFHSHSIEERFLYDLAKKNKELDADRGKVHCYDIFYHSLTLVSPN